MILAGVAARIGYLSLERCNIKHYKLELIAAIIGSAALIWLSHFYRRKTHTSA